MQNEAGSEVDEALLRRMCASIVHRGPDDEGFYVSGQAGLCMRRLEVIDLAGGHQPMCNEDGTLWIVFNGEIYNYPELRRQLLSRGHVLKSASDTEVVLHLFEEKGAQCLEELQGMFAVAIWNTRERSLFLARDPVGKKPLYYAVTSQGLTFGSELQALMCDPAVDDTIDHQAIDEYLSYLFVPHPRTIYRGAKKLTPGSWALYRDGQFESARYWSVDYSPQETAEGKNAEDTVDALLQQAVERRLVADVPLGAFLSGGLDSSLIVALMKKKSGERIRTVSVGFDDSSYDELQYARQVAEQLDTEHSEVRVTYDALQVLPSMLRHFGEPFADSSAIPMYQLSKVTREHVTVALSGDGADEVFGGYRRYRARPWVNLYNGWPPWLGRGCFESVMGRIGEPAGYYGASKRKKVRRFMEFAEKVGESPSTSWAFFFTEEEKGRLYDADFQSELTAGDGAPSYQGYYERQRHAGSQAMLWLDLMTYLPDDILTKVDRMSMACSLEVRAPFLDKDVVEFMSTVPRKRKFTGLSGKNLLRSVARRYLPDNIVDRRKHGFAVPVASWLKNELRPWMEELLLGQTFKQRGFFNAAYVEMMVNTHLSSKRDYSQQLWALLVLEMWLQDIGEG